MLGNNGPIRFYSKDEPYYEFTNFANFPIIVDGQFYNTSEHYFQSQKLVGTPYVEYVALLPRPRDAFEFPRQPHIAYWVRKDWQSVKESVMYKGLYHKFTQYSNLKKLLLETGNRKLVEDSPHDSYWGIGRDGRGLNQLGNLLMNLRGALRSQRVSTDGNQSSTRYEPLYTQMNCDPYHDSTADTNTRTESTNRLNVDSTQENSIQVAVPNPHSETGTRQNTQNANPVNLHSAGNPQVMESSQEKLTNENPQAVNPTPETLDKENADIDPQVKNTNDDAVAAENQQCGCSKPKTSQPETNSENPQVHGNLTLKNPTQDWDTTPESAVGDNLPSAANVSAVGDNLPTVDPPANVGDNLPTAANVGDNLPTVDPPANVGDNLPTVGPPANVSAVGLHSATGPPGKSYVAHDNNNHSHLQM